jgi:hypothetical protein
MIAPLRHLVDVSVAYPQGTKDHCLFLCVAYAIHYMGLFEEASKLRSLAYSAEVMSGRKGLEVLQIAMKDCAPTLGLPTVFISSQKHQKRLLTMSDLVEGFTPYPTLIIPLGLDGNINHAICVVEDLIFDSTQAYAMKCTVAALHWICNCGKKGFLDIFIAYRFETSFKCKRWKREFQSNW